MKYEFNKKEVNAITLLLSFVETDAVKEMIEINTHLTDKEVDAVLVTLESLRIGIRAIASKNKIVHY